MSILKWGLTSLPKRLDPYLYLIAICYDYILLWNQLRHSILWDDILDLKNKMNELRWKTRLKTWWHIYAHIYLYILLLFCKLKQEVATLSKCLPPRSPGCLLSSGAEQSVHLQWLYAGCRCLPPGKCTHQGIKLKEMHSAVTKMS